MNITLLYIVLTILALITSSILFWLASSRKYQSSSSVANAYDQWTNDYLLEKLWGEHIHLGYYPRSSHKEDFRQAKVELVHQLIKWSGLINLPPGSRVIDVGCGIGGSSRILAKDYGFDVLGITISPEQVRRAAELTPENLSCRFEVMDAMKLNIQKGSFDGVFSIEAGPHMPDKQLYADEMLRVLRPGGILVVADWNIRDPSEGLMNILERLIVRQLLTQWAHPEFSSIQGFKQNLLNSKYIGGYVEVDDWTSYTVFSWIDSILEGLRRPDVTILSGPINLFKSIRELPTILLMNWAFSSGLMKFGVFSARG